jgi:general secretion pathway protein B
VTKAAPLPAPTASAATSAEARLYTLSELPEDVRSGLPALSVGGAMYSQTPANRMLIINGQVFREGDALAPGLVLEQIKLKSAVLKVKGLRFGISY